ncbi:MAG TPA: hypothetical protein VNX68_02235 [Nitrosopumilaceae archaeon]|nr:hypothetical protein [Nitrosopumilaceae archaeon]
MSVEKILTFEEIPYFQLYTHVVQNITNLEAGFVWVYLMSKPKDWDVIKEHLKNKFKIGDDKLKNIFAYLSSHQLIQYIKHRDDKGKIIKHETRILNGSKFLTDEQVKELSTKESSTGVKTHPVANHTCGFRALHIKENTNKIKIKKERESSLRTSYCRGSHDLIISEEAIRICNAKKLDIDKIVYSFMSYANSNGWLRLDWKAAFVKWVTDEREIIVKTIYPELRSTVKEYGPGHPTWEANRAWELKYGKGRIGESHGSEGTGNNARRTNM